MIPQPRSAGGNDDGAVDAVEQGQTPSVASAAADAGGLARLLKNSAANVAGGMSNAFLAVVLPPVLVRQFAPQTFDVWSVILQLAAIVGVFQFGLQVAVGRYIAFHTARNELRERAEIAGTAQAALWVLSAVALVVVLALAWMLPLLVPGMPQTMVPAARLALVLMGAGFALGLPATAAAGIFTGLQRNEVPATFVVVSRAAIAVAVIALAMTGSGLVTIAAAYGGIIALTGLLQLYHARSRLPELALRRERITRRAGAELLSYCVSMTIWSMSILAISGLDAVIAGHFDFGWAGYYAVAASVVLLLVGLQGAVLQPLVAVAASLHSRGERKRLGGILVEATYLNTLLFMVLGVVLLVAGEPLLKAWLGAEYGALALPVVQIVLAGMLLRQTLAPYATILLGTGEQRLVIWTPLYEAAAKLAASIALAAWIGPIGVALGTVAGAVVCIATNLAMTYPKVRGFDAPLSHFAARGLLRPALAFAPLIAVVAALLSMGSAASPLMVFACAALAIAIGAALAYPAMRRLQALL